MKRLVLEILFSSALWFVLAGCAPSFRTVWPKSERTRTYELGQEQTVAPGERIFAVTNGQRYETYRIEETIEEPPKPPELRAAAPITPSQRWRVVGRDKKGNMQLESPDYSGAMPWLLVGPDGRVKSWWSNRNGLPGTNRWPEGARFVPAEPVLAEGAFQAELLYSGTDGRTMRAAYREFVGGTARPAFCQELSFDLSESRIVRFRSVVVEVLEASPLSLRYRVVEDGDLPWLPS